MKEYDDSLPFWDAFYGKENYDNVTYSTKDLSFACPVMEQCVAEIAGRKRILDYGCGDGWLSFALLNAGASCITAVDPSATAVETGAAIAERRGDSERIRFVRGTQEFLKAGTEKPFDGFVSVNVLDVVPESVADDILQAIKASLAPDAEGLILLNPAYDEDSLLKREGASIIRDESGKDIPHHIAINGVLRLVVRTTDEWKALFSRYFDVTHVGDFAFAFEEAPQYKRRIFRLRNRA